MKIKFTWGKGLILFFILFFVWIFSFVFFAMRQNIDLVSEDYYQKGADYSKQIAIDKRSAPFQDSISVRLQGDKVLVELGRNTVSTSDSIEVYFFRPSDKTRDVRMNFRNTDTPFQVDRTLLSHGRYFVYVSWGSPSEKYTVKKVLDIE